MTWWTPQLAAIAWGMFQALVILLGAVLLGPLLHGSEGMFDALATLIEHFRAGGKARRHPFQHSLVFVSGDIARRSVCAARLERARPAGGGVGVDD
jgi:hypothetical protein